MAMTSVMAVTIAIGPVFQFQRHEISFDEISDGLVLGWERLQDALGRAREQLDALNHEMAEKGLTIVGSDDPGVRLGLLEMREFFDFWERELPKVFRDWEAERAQRLTLAEEGKR